MLRRKAVRRATASNASVNGANCSGAHRQAAGVLMAAELFQMFGAAAERLDHVKAADAARRAFADAVLRIQSPLSGDEIARLRATRRCRAHPDASPRLPGTKEWRSPPATAACRLRQRLLLHLRFDRASITIMFFQFLGDALRCFAGVRRQQFDDFDAVVDPAGGIDARSQAKSHLPSADSAVANPGHRLSATTPGRVEVASSLSPRLINVRLTPLSGTISAMVPSVTMSRKWRISGAAPFLNQPASRSLARKPITNKRPAQRRTDLCPGKYSPCDGD